MLNFKWPSMQRCQLAMADLQRYPWKLRRIKYALSVSMFLLFLVCFNFRFICFVHFLFIGSNGETHRNKHLSSQENVGIFHNFYPIKVSRVKSGIKMHGGSLEITLTVPLIWHIYIELHNYSTLYILDGDELYSCPGFSSMVNKKKRIS